MAAPEEIIASPLTVYLAPIGTAMPAIDAAPTSPWATLGIEGDLSYDESGVVVSHAETVFDVTPAGSTMPVKRFRTGESLLTKLVLMDVTPETYAMVMNDAVVTTGAGEKSFDLYRGDIVNSFAVLMRGVSPVDQTLNMQYEIPKAFVSVNGDVTYNKGVVASLPIEIQMIRHASDGSDDPICRIATSSS